MSGLTDFLKGYAPGLERTDSDGIGQNQPNLAKPGIDAFLQDYHPDVVAPPAEQTPGSPIFTREQQEHVDASANLLEARRVQPEEAGRALIASQETGIPPDVTQRNLGTVEAQAELERDRVALRAARGTAKWYGDQRNAAIAHDKVAQMSAWEQYTHAMQTGISEGWSDTAIAPLVEKQMNGQPLTPSESVQVEAWRADRQKPTGIADWSVNAGVRNFAAFVSGLTAQAVGAAPLAMSTAMAGGAVGGLALGPEAAPAGFVLGAGAGISAGMFDQGRIQATAFTYERLRAMEEETGAKMDPDTMRWVSNAVGAIGGTLNMIGFGQAAKPFGQLADTVSRMLLEEAAAKPSVVQALKAIGGGTAKGFGMGVGLGAANEASMVAGETLAAEIENLARGGKFADVLNDPDKRIAAAQQIVDSAITMGMTLAGLHMATGAPRLAAEAVRVHRAAGDARFFDALVAGTEASGLVERPTGRDAIQRWLGIQLDEGPHDTVYVPAAKLVELYQDATRVGGEQDPLFSHIGGLAEQVRDALPVNGDVAIPAKDFFARLVGTPALEKLKGDVRMREDGYSLNEAAEAAKQREALLKAARERWETEAADGVQPDPTTRVFEHWRDALTLGAGFTQTAATHQAALYAAHYAARAARRPDLYADAWDAFQKAGTGAGVELRTDVPPRIRAAAPDHLDMLLHSLRSGRDPKLPETGPSLLQYISSRGGLLDEGGELKARDLDKWHLTPKGRERAGVNPIIAEPGAVAQQAMFGRSTVEGKRLTLHDTAIAAWEDGYFPELTEAPTESHLLAAIDEELRGQPRFTEAVAHDAAAAFREDRALLDETLNRLGIDVKATNNAGVRKALAGAIVRDDNRPTYDQAVFHGSPYYFDKFTLDHIGTGEGAQAFGWGLYFAGSKEVARYYRQVLSAGKRPVYEIDGKPTTFLGARTAVYNALRPEMTGIDRASYAHRLAEIMEMVDEGRSTSEIRKVWPGKSEVVDRILDTIDRVISIKEPGRLYHVDIPEAGNYLHWERPLGEQPEKVRDALGGMGLDLRPDMTGEEIYRQLGEKLSTAKEPGDWLGFVQTINDRASNDRAASMALREAGIFGIEYLDAGSRRAGDGTHNYVLFDDAAARIVRYEQDGKRASITLGDGRAVIQLFQSRNLSSLLHESGHLWLEELRVDATRGGATPAIGRMWSETLKWLGIDERSWDGEFTRDQHEKFARGFEAYLMEGKAPSTALASAFRAFKNWLVQIYRKLSALDAPLSPEMRDVFDRLVATDDEIEAARQKQTLNPLFTDAKAAGMSEEQFRAYTERSMAVVDEAEQRVLNKAMEGIRTKRGKEWRAEEKRTRAEVRAEQMQDPGQQALYFLRLGKIFDGETPEALKGAKLDKADIIQEYGDESALRLLPRGIYREENGYSADSLASLFGFDSGRAMLDRLAHLEAERQAMAEKGDRRSVLRAAVDEETHSRMQEKMGGHLDEQAIAEEAMAAVHSDKQAALIGAELKALARRAGETAAIKVDDVKGWAQDRVGEMTAREALRFQRFLQAERSAGIRAERALQKGDFLGAFKAKQDQLANSRLYVEAKKAADEVGSAQALLDRYAGARTIKSMDQDYLEQIHGLLEDYDFKRRTDRDLDRVRNFELWAANQKAEGIDGLGDKLSERMRSQIGKLNYRDLTVDELRGLVDTVKQIAALGRLSKELTVNQAKREFNATLDEFQAQLHGLPQLDRPEERNPQMAGAGVRESQRAWLVRFKAGLRSFDASLLKVEQIADWADNGKSTGLFNTLLFRPFGEAQARENDMVLVKARQLKAASDAVPADIKKGWQQRVDVPELKTVTQGKSRGAFLKSDLIAIALNLGNDSNKQKMLEGDGWSEETVRAALDKHLVKEDWQFVQRVWDIIEELWPHAAELERRVNGVEAPKIEATPVETPFGTFRGGYYPAAYDISLSPEARAAWTRREGSMFDEQTYTRATTSQGYQKGRTGFSAPILLDLNVIPRHIAQVIHDITHREALRQAVKIIQDKRFVEGFEGAFGHEFYQVLMPWLKSIAGNMSIDDTAQGFWSNAVKAVRVNTSMVGMGLRASTMLTQITGHADTAEMLGPKWTAIGNASFLGDPARMMQTRDFVFDKSGEMRHRMDNTERDIREGLRSLLGQDGWLPEVRRFAYYGIGMFDLAVSVPAWMGGYKKALHEGMSDADAVYYADKVVRLSQGAGGMKDLSPIQASRNESMKLFSMFYSWASHFYNRQRDIGRTAMGNVGERDFAMIAARSFFLMLAAPLAGQMLTGNGPKEDEDWGAWALRNVGFNLFAGVPVVRDMASTANSALGNGFGSYAVTPAARGGDAIWATAKDVWNSTLGQGQVSDKWIKHALETGGYVFGLPLGQPAATVQFLWDESVGAQDAQTVGEWYRGLTTGRAREK